MVIADYLAAQEEIRAKDGNLSIPFYVVPSLDDWEKDWERGAGERKTSNIQH